MSKIYAASKITNREYRRLINHDIIKILKIMKKKTEENKITIIYSLNYLNPFK